MINKWFASEVFWEDLMDGLRKLGTLLIVVSQFKPWPTFYLRDVSGFIGVEQVCGLSSLKAVFDYAVYEHYHHYNDF